MKKLTKHLLVFLLLFSFGTKEAFAVSQEGDDANLTIQREWEEKLLKQRDVQLKDAFKIATEELKKEKPPIKPIFRVKPYADASCTYDDNIYKTANKTADFFYTLNFGLSLFFGAELKYLKDLSLKGAGLKKNYLFDEGRFGDLDFGTSLAGGVILPIPEVKFNLGFSSTRYNKTSALDVEPFKNFNNGFVPDLNFEYKLGRSKRKIDLKQKISPAIKPLSLIQVGGQGQVRYFESLTEISWEQGFNRLGYSLGYKRNSTSYESLNQGSDYLDQKVILNGFMQAFPRLRFFMETQLGTGEYVRAVDNGNDVKYLNGYLGASGNLAQKTIGTVRVGYQDRAYKNGSELISPSLDVNIDYKYSDRMRYSLLFSRASQDGNYAADGFDDNTSIALNFNYIFTQRLSFDINPMTFQNDKYGSGRRDDTFSSSFGLKHNFHEWVFTEFKYSRLDRKSNIAEASFVDNTYTMSTRLVF